LALLTGDDDWTQAMVALYTIALGNPTKGLTELENLIVEEAQPAALKNALGDAEILARCPTPIAGIAEAIALLQAGLDEREQSFEN
jgi:hypothetical protein